jgi:hypothetical protein
LLDGMTVVERVSSRAGAHEQRDAGSSLALTARHQVAVGP